jgi:hypothetical protein
VISEKKQDFLKKTKKLLLFISKCDRIFAVACDFRVYFSIGGVSHGKMCRLRQRCGLRKRRFSFTPQDKQGMEAQYPQGQG